MPLGVEAQGEFPFGLLGADPGRLENVTWKGDDRVGVYYPLFTRYCSTARQRSLDLIAAQLVSNIATCA